MNVELNNNIFKIKNNINILELKLFVYEKFGIFPDHQLVKINNKYINDNNYIISSDLIKSNIIIFTKLT